MLEHMAIMHPVAFVSRTLTCTETRYTTTEHELLALVFCFHTGDDHSQILVHSYHEPVTWLETQPRPGQHQAR